VTAQDLSQGQLIITVIEGMVEAISFIEPHSRINTFTAFPFDQSQLLNLRDIEQGLEQINRLQSNNASMELLPGKQPGSSIIQLKSPRSKQWKTSLSRDNTGQRSTGELKNTLFFSIDNPLGLNDFSYFNFQQDNEPQSTKKESKSLSWHWDMPLGYWNMGVDISYFEYLSTVQSVGQQFDSSGTNLSQTVFLSRTLHRSQNNKLKLHSRLERKKSENFIQDTLLNSSRTLAVANIGIQYEHYLANNDQWDLSLNYYRGLPLFNAPNDAHRSQGSAKAQFDKVTAHINYKHDISISDAAPTHFKSKLFLQHSNDILFGSEQISVGSLYTVRGYKGSSISAASGAYWQNTFSHDFSTAWGGGVIKQISPFIAFDIGSIRDSQQVYSDKPYAVLKGWATGVQIQGKTISATLSYARPIDSPRFLVADQEQWYFTLSATL